MEKTTIEEQIGNISNFVITFDNVIKDMDNIIDIYQRQRITFIEKRAQFNVLKDILISSTSNTSKGVHPLREGVEAGATVIGAGIVSSHPVAAAIIAGAVVINRKLDEAIKEVDKQNARIEQTLKEQREWKDKHPGHQRQ